MRLIDTPNGPLLAGNDANDVDTTDALERMAGYYDARYPDPCEGAAVYPTRAEGLCAADERHAALERRVKALERTLADGLTAAYLLGAADTRALLEPLHIQVDALRAGMAQQDADHTAALHAFVAQIATQAAQHAAEIEALRTLLERLLREVQR